MPPRSVPGTCLLCDAEKGKRAMARHVQSCAASSPGKGTPVSVFLLRAEAAPFWLYAAARRDAELRDLDAFLRDTWLECCGHMSSFRIAGGRYTEPPQEEADVLFGPPDRAMDITLSHVLRPNLSFEHDYDFGSTTTLQLAVVGEREMSMGKREPVRLLARNEDPVWDCAICRKPAAWICVECENDSPPFLCQTHARKHEHDEMLLPVVNSPRMGVCGYEG